LVLFTGFGGWRGPRFCAPFSIFPLGVPDLPYFPLTIDLARVSATILRAPKILRAGPVRVKRASGVRTQGHFRPQPAHAHETVTFDCRFHGPALHRAEVGSPAGAGHFGSAVEDPLAVLADLGHVHGGHESVGAFGELGYGPALGSRLVGMQGAGVHVQPFRSVAGRVKVEPGRCDAGEQGVAAAAVLTVCVGVGLLIFGRVILRIAAHGTHEVPKLVQGDGNGFGC